MAQTRRVTGVATNVRIQDSFTIVRYHDTDVVRFNAESIFLNVGGWKSATTKTRMNQASNQYSLGYSVFQRKGEWFVRWKGKDIPYTGDGIMFLNR